MHSPRNSTAADHEFDLFASSTRFPALDGLRAVSILLVLLSHMHDPFWSAINGGLGVTIFFGLSGFLITTLLLREEDRNDRVSLKNFYIRRVFRILPLYLLALALTSALVLGLGLGQGGSNFLQRLPLLATFNGEFAGSGTFAHSWSLGIEEKFYVIWPLLAFSVPVVRRSLGRVLLLAVPVAAVSSFIPSTGYFGIYFPILGGCALAVAMHNRSSFRVVHTLANPWISSALFLAMIVFIAADVSILSQDVSKYAHVVFAALALLAMPGFLIRSGWQWRALSVAPVVFYGSLAYGIYLFHPFVGEAVDRLVESGQTSAPLAIARFAGVFVASFGLAWILHVTVETPLISLGRRLTRAPGAPSTVEAESPVPKTI